MPTLEHQQAVVVDMLRRADGGAVSFDELRNAGVEFPASVVAELELAGIPLQRCRVGGERGRRGTGVQLDLRAGESPRGEEEAPTEAIALGGDGALDTHEAGDAVTAHERIRPRFPPAPAPPARGRARDLRSGRTVAWGSEPPRGPRQLADEAPARRVRAFAWVSLPVVALAAACVAALALAVSVLAGGAHHSSAALREIASTKHSGASQPVRRGGASQPARAATPATGTAPAQSGAGPSGASAQAPAPLSTTKSAPPSSSQPQPARGGGDQGHESEAGDEAGGYRAPSRQLAETLETRGHELLESGRYATATAVLNRAVAATGESAQACTQPSSEACLTYAYALYDLGRSLQLGGNAAAAVPVLSQRLRIDNQRATVMQALALARAQARTGGAG